MQCNNGVAQEHNATVRRHRVESVCGWTRGQRGGIGLGKKIGIYERPNLRRVGLHPGNSTLTDIREERRFSSFGFLILSRQTSLRHPQRPDEIRHFCHFLTEGYYRTEGGTLGKVWKPWTVMPQTYYKVDLFFFKIKSYLFHYHGITNVLFPEITRSFPWDLEKTWFVISR